MITSIRHSNASSYWKGSSRRHGAPVAAFLLFLASAGHSAENAITAGPKAAETHRGFYYALPGYLYDPYSASGVQLGYELANLHVRLDLSLASGYRNGQVILFANPSLGAFYSETWPTRIRTYQGIAFGGQTGILNAFAGQAFFLNFIVGAEWLVSEKKAVFLEIGKGLALPRKDGAFNGGTIIGGGFKSFF